MVSAADVRHIFASGRSDDGRRKCRRAIYLHAVLIPYYCVNTVTSNNLKREEAFEIQIKTKLLLLLCSVSVAVLAAEAVLVAVGFSYSPMTIEQIPHHRNDYRRHHIPGDDHFTYDSQLLWRPKPGFKIFNVQGFRGRELSDDKGDQFRILAIGDSNTLGWGGQEGANWPHELEKVLRKVSDRYVVSNAGVWGYTSFQGMRRLQEAVSLQPDIVLLSFGSNDAHPVGFSDAEYAHFSLSAPRSMLAKSRIVQLVSAAWNANQIRQQDRTQLVHRVNLTDYSSNLRKMVKLARDHNAIPVLLTRPYFGSSTDPTWWKTYAPQYAEATLQIAEQTDTLAIDVYTWFKNHDACFADESHFTSQGHAEAAQLILSHLGPILPATPSLGAASEMLAVDLTPSCRSNQSK